MSTNPSTEFCKHEMLTADCSICNHPSNPDAPRLKAPERSDFFRARFDSTVNCRECDLPIYRNQIVYYVGETLVHMGCG
jgi:hypothetical protein